MTSDLVIKHNKLIEAKYDLTLNEQKLIIYAISKIDRTQEDFNIIKIQVTEFGELIGVNSEIYVKIKQMVKVLSKKEVYINNNEEEIITTWLSSRYKKGTGIVELEFSKFLTPYLLQLQEQYTKYELKNIIKIKSKYAIRIYELLKQYQKFKKREFKLEELKNHLGCNGKYNDFKNFRDRVLNPSMNEINKCTDIDISYEKLTIGKKVDGIKFIIKAKTKEEIVEEVIQEDNFDLYSSDDIQSIREQTNITEFTDRQLIEIYEIAMEKVMEDDLDVFKYIKLNYDYVCSRKNVISKLALLRKSLKEDYAKARIKLKYENEE